MQIVAHWRSRRAAADSFFPLGVPVEFGRARSLLLGLDFRAPSLTILMIRDELQQDFPRGRLSGDGDFHHPDRQQLALRLVDDLPADIGGDCLIELAHKDVAEAR